MDEKIREAKMKRYFGTINENREDIRWELNKKTNDVSIMFPYCSYYSPLCIDLSGDLFTVFEETTKDKLFKILFLSESSEGMLEYFDVNELTSKDALLWAKYIGDRDVMINKITNPRYAFYWVLDIGNQDVMIDKITNSEYAYWWAKDIGDKEIMKERITDEYWMKKFEKL